MQIRRATLDDAELLAELNQPIQQLHADARPDFFKPAQVSEALIQVYREALSQPETHIYIGEVNSKPIGCVVTKIIHRPENPFSYAAEVLLVDQISVNPEHQGRGYGKLLMQAAYDLARSHNIHRIILDVWAFNSHAIDFYQQQGFNVYNQRMEIKL